MTLLTDFGLEDSYVAEMKGVILSLNPKAELLDLSHLIPAGDISVAALRLWRAYRHFPKGTIHLAVVDPGVGTSRELLLAVSRAYYFLVPDNGLLSPILQEAPARCYALHPRRWKGGLGATFHGRDLLAPAAALLSLGKAPQRLGRPFTRATLLPFWATAKGKGGGLQGKVIDIDRFGNLVTNIRASQLIQRKKFQVHYRRWRFSSLSKTYGWQKKVKPILLVGSGGLLEIALPQASAKELVKGSIGQRVTVRYE